MKGAELVARKLKSAGCDIAFGIPGGEVLALVDGFKSQEIEFILVKHENAGGFMAEGAFHATGKPGILLATLGPGVANAMNVVANAMQDRVPLLFLTGRVDPEIAETYTHQIFDHQQMVRPVVKGSFTLAEGAIGATMDMALKLAREGQPGPVHIDVPIGVAEGNTSESYRPAPALAAPVVSVGADFLAARDALSGSERPLIIAGLDAVNDDLGPSITRFCREYGIPIITTYKAKGLLDERDPLSLGGAGLSPKADQFLHPLVRSADCILLVGYDPIEMRIGWKDLWNAEAQTVIDITPVTRIHGMHDVTLSLVGSVGPIFDNLVDAMPKKPHWPDADWQKTRDDLKEAFRAPSSGFGPAQVIEALAEAIPPEAAATTDSGAHRILFSQKRELSKPHRIFQSTALCTMGGGLPLAMGYKLREPDVPVFVFIGDGCLEMAIGELATLRDLKLPIPIIVMSDASLSLIELKQRGGQRGNLGVDFGSTDLPAVARAYGGYGVWIDDTETLKREAKASFERDTFSVLACRIGRRAYDGLF